MTVADEESTTALEGSLETLTIDAAPAEEGFASSPAVEIDLSKTHPLRREWIMWYDNPVGRSSWTMDRFKQIHDFGTVEEFWRMFNNIVAPSQLCNGSNYHMFLNGVKPMWEDEANCRGGKWIIIFPKSRKDLLDEFWTNVLLSIIGESLDGVEEVSGCVASVRKGNSKIAVWTRDYANKDGNMRIGLYLKENLASAEMWKSCKVEYQKHEDPNAGKDSAGPPTALYTL